MSGWRSGSPPRKGRDVAVVQIAGLVARRIVTKLTEGQEIATGERFGLIRFGSRTDVYLPLEWAPLVVAGPAGHRRRDRDRRRRLPAKPARQGRVH